VPKANSSFEDKYRTSPFLSNVEVEHQVASNREHSDEDSKRAYVWPPERLLKRESVNAVPDGEK
jgi:hypothetical protein